MKKQRTRIGIILTLIVILLGTTLMGCERNNRSQSASTSASYAPSYGYTSAKSTSYDMGAGAYDDYLAEEGLYESYDMDDMDEEIAYKESASIDVEEPEPETEPDAPISPDKLVYTGSLSVETTEYVETLARIRSTISEMGGFIESENESDNSYGWYYSGYQKSSSTLSAQLQVRIPSARFYEFLDGIEGDTCKVTNRSVYVDNISRKYSETATTIESLQIQEGRLLEMMEEAKKISDMLEIESRLSEVQNSLKIYRNSLASMDTDVMYSTVSLYIREVGIYTQPEATSFLDKIQDAFFDAVYGFVDGVQAFSIWLVRNFLVILVWILVIYIIVKILRHLISKWKKGANGKNEGGKKKGFFGRKKKDEAPAETDDTKGTKQG